jgi:GNAT superfamily N-acetyltransferase
MVTYKPISFFEKGRIQKILKASYQDFFIYFPGEKKKLYHQWEREEEEAFSNPIIGNHVLFTCIKGSPIGYFSWDDRNFPIGQVGQNCIIPQYQNQGYGRKQIAVIEEKFKEFNFKEVTVVTGDHEFFAPAQKMYLACGFQKKRPINGTLFENVEFFKYL